MSGLLGGFGSGLSVGSVLDAWSRCGRFTFRALHVSAKDAADEIGVLVGHGLLFDSTLGALGGFLEGVLG